MAGQLYSSGKVFSSLIKDEDIIENQKEIVSFPLFSNESATLTSLFTASYLSNTQKQYYLDVVSSPNSTDAEFSIAYGHIDGSGSLRGDTYTYPSKAIYSQYKQLLLEPGETLFKFADGTTTNHIYVINFKTERFKQRIDPGNWQITLTTLNGSMFLNNVYTGSNVDVNPAFLTSGLGGSSIENYRIVLSDDSTNTYDTVNTLLSPKVSYNIVPKLIQGIFGFSPSLVTSSYGLLYPSQGIIILDANKLNSIGFNTVTGSNINGDNAYKLYFSLSSSLRTDVKVPALFGGGTSSLSPTTCAEGRGNEIVTSTYYYCRIKNNDYNFSTNPSFTTGSIGDLKFRTMINDPKVYITSVGLYNNRQELLAVAKISKPILKTFSREATIKVKLDW